MEMQLRYRLMLLLGIVGVSSYVFIRLAAPPPQTAQIERDWKESSPLSSIPDTVHLEELTSYDVRVLVANGFTNVIVPTGGVEQNGPYLVLGKHDFIVRAVAERIARRVGKTLVAPVVPFVPQGSTTPPTGHMRYAGSISATDETFQALLKDIIGSLRVHGFKTIILIGDSGGNQSGLAAVAEAERAASGNIPARVLYLPEYYDYDVVRTLLREKYNLRENDEGFHDELAFTLQVLAINPEYIRSAERQKDGRLSLNGVALSPLEQYRKIGEEILDFRAERTAASLKSKLH